MGRTGLRICDRCRALEKVGDDVTRPCKACGYPGPDRRASARHSYLPLQAEAEAAQQSA
ncbi:MAG TPA: hypothetical protein VFH47_05350 [Candidatus Thermoplasmatota archaeon]|nr:hypothetical protein [Candidatus Thermoplasmatota archaeon]